MTVAPTKQELAKDIQNNQSQIVIEGDITPELAGSLAWTIGLLDRVCSTFLRGIYLFCLYPTLAAYSLPKSANY